MKRVSIWLLPLSLLFTMGQAGCPVQPITNGFRPAPAIVVNNPSGTSRSISFSVDLTLFPDAVSINWDFGDNSSANNLPPASGRVIAHDYAADGRFTVRVFIFGRDRLLAQNQTNVQVLGPNVPPIAAFNAVPSADPADPPRTLRFDASASRDPNGAITNYAWDFGDNSPAGSGQVTTHTYATSGRFTVRLTVTDDRGATASVTQSVAANLAPTADFSFAPTGPEAPQLLTVNFDGTLSADSDGSVVSFTWDFGDGESGVGPTPQHTYAIQGTYDVRLTVTDNLGGLANVTKPVAILGTRPFVRSITPVAGDVNATVNITDLSGGNFAAGAAVRLTRNGQPDIPGINVQVVDASRITCSFDLTGAALGDWNVVVRNPDAFEGVLEAGFRVVQADRVRISTTEGDIVLQLDRVAAPGHVANFLRYVDEGRYEGIVFHRVPPNFVIQAGSFRNIGGTGVSPRLEEVESLPTIPSEANNGRSNVRGTIALALRGQDANSGSSQFFINVRDNPNLDTGPPPFTVFGEVVSGLDVVDRISRVRTGSARVLLLDGSITTFQDVPVEDVTILSARRE